ncbi:helix-turn-helix domain-containing protein [Fulvivirgaceae bacterium BMA10]|uniref:Helix-turn-helix domain-containing protein n=1 Tax=Splendidivirga corallicola TaxID=3051826 RepID=A0ABT8KKY4_9BACT|nr:helix-turn-helix domain-containing protein [Fulvivirgaceae bacterium BMA10]
MNDIMTIEEVARYLKMKPQTIYTWAQNGKIPAAKIGKEWRFKRAIIDEWFNQHIDEKFQPIVQKLQDKNDKMK